MRLPRLYRRPPRGWADVKRELEAAGVPRVDREPEQDTIDVHDLRSAPSTRSRRPQSEALPNSAKQRDRRFHASWMRPTFSPHTPWRHATTRHR